MRRRPGQQQSSRTRFGSNARNLKARERGATGDRAAGQPGILLLDQPARSSSNRVVRPPRSRGRGAPHLQGQRNPSLAALRSVLQTGIRSVAAAPACLLSAGLPRFLHAIVRFKRPSSHPPRPDRPGCGDNEASAVWPSAPQQTKVITRSLQSSSTISRSVAALSPTSHGPSPTTLLWPRSVPSTSTSYCYTLRPTAVERIPGGEA